MKGGGAVIKVFPIWPALQDRPYSNKQEAQEEQEGTNNFEQMLETEINKRKEE